MPIWTINGVPLATLGVTAILRYGQQAADTLTLTQTGPDYDGPVLFTVRQAVVLRLVPDLGSPVIWFQGKVRLIARAAETQSEALVYTCMGGWDLLSRRNYLQNFAQANDVNDPLSTLTTTTRGRVILCQDDAGLKISATEFIKAVLDYAIASGVELQKGTINIPYTLPWDEVTDLKDADAIQRVLQFIPDAQAWVDHRTTPPSFNCVQQPALEPAMLTLQPKGSPDNPVYLRATSVRVEPRDDIRVSTVVLIYLWTNTTNGAGWQGTARDAWPVDATGLEEDALVRTIQLAGSVTNFAEQRCKIRPIDPALVFTTAITTTDSAWGAVSTFWLRKLKHLTSNYVTLIGFRKGTRVVDNPDDPTEALDSACERELIEGAITDWMIDNKNIKHQVQKLTVEVVYDIIPDPAHPAVKERRAELLTTRIRATSAQSQLYSLLDADSSVLAEPMPTGLAKMLWDALNAPRYDGRVVFKHEQPAVIATTRNAINISGTAANWTAIGSPAQGVEIDLSNNTTAIDMGTPKQITADDLVAIYRQNRGRILVSSYQTRTTGQVGTNQTRQGLGVYGPINDSAATRFYPATLDVTVTPAGVMPTVDEIRPAIVGAYDSQPFNPKSGDWININISGVTKFRYQVSLTAPAATDLFNFYFDYPFTSGTRFYVKGHQVGIY